MSKADSPSFSRRQWLGLTPALAAASLGSGLLAQKSLAENPPATANANPSGEKIYDIREFGAKGDGATIDTAAVQSAIDTATQANGGVVFVPPGNFLIGTIELKSNVTLRLAPQGKLLGSDDISHYHAGNGIPASNGNIVLISAANV